MSGQVEIAVLERIAVALERLCDLFDRAPVAEVTLPESTGSGRVLKNICICGHSDTEHLLAGHGVCLNCSCNLFYSADTVRKGRE